MASMSLTSTSRLTTSTSRSTTSTSRLTTSTSCGRRRHRRHVDLDVIDAMLTLTSSTLFQCHVDVDVIDADLTFTPCHTIWQFGVAALAQLSLTKASRRVLQRVPDPCLSSASSSLKTRATPIGHGFWS
jgi:hypothetical protein